MRAVLFALTLAFTVAAVETPGSAADNVYDQLGEQRFGFLQDTGFVSTSVLLFDDRISRRVSEIGNRVAQAAGKDIDYSFRVINDTRVNAAAVAGGFIYVFTGLLDTLGSEAELAAILAHEIAHTVESHSVRKYRSSKQSERTVRGIGATFGFVLNVGGRLVQGPVAALVQSGLATGSQAGLAAVHEAAVAGYSRELETEADRKAVRYLIDAGYDPNALIHVLEKFITLRERVKLQKKRGYSSHLLNAKPGLETRVDTLRSEIEQLCRTLPQPKTSTCAE